MKKGIVVVLMMAFTACSLLGGEDGPEIPGKIVFAANDSTGNSQIFSMRADGTELRQLTFLEGDEAYMPAWSPDGTQIVFSTSLQSSSNGFSLYIMDADGGNMRPMNEREGSHIPTPGNNARWSPDGARIVFDLCTNCQVGTNHELFLYEFATDSVIQLTDTDFPVSNRHPVWSPDGQRIAFISDRDYADADTMQFRKDLYVMDADGSNPDRLTESGFPGDYTWMDGGNIILSETDKDTKLKSVSVINVPTDDMTPLLENLEVKNQLWIFWDPAREQLLTINKNHKEVPVIISSYNLKGKKIQEYQLDSTILKSAISFDWFIPNDN